MHIGKYSPNQANQHVHCPTTYPFMYVRMVITPKVYLFASFKYTRQYCWLSHIDVCQFPTIYSSCIPEILCPLANIFPFSHSPSPWEPPSHSLFLWVWQVQIPHTNEIMQYLSFFILLISLSIMSSRFIHAVANGRISVFLKAEYYSIIHTHTHSGIAHIFFIHSAVDQQLFPYLDYCE